jgi:uncharacterized protein DUF6502
MVIRRLRQEQDQERAINKVLVQLFGLLARVGWTKDELIISAHSCIDAALNEWNNPLPVSGRIGAVDFAIILRTWHRLARYLSSDGLPRPLQYEGKDGLRSLIARHCPATEIGRVYAELQSAGLIKKARGNRWIPTRRHAVLPNLTTQLLNHLSEGVSRLVETVIGNVTVDDKENVLFERSAEVRNFPAKAAADFRVFVNTQAASFLSAVDDWMETQAELSNRKKHNSCTAGVYTFAFMDKRTPTKRKGSHSARALPQERKFKVREATHPSTRVARSSPRSSSANRS